MGRKIFEMYEIEAFLGDYAKDYDIDAIIEEATEIDYSTGNRYWRKLDNGELMQIAETHDLTNER